MVGLTKQERSVLLALALICSAGTGLDYAYKRIPGLDHIVNILDSDGIYAKVDLNRVGFDELLTVPSIGPSVAARIIQYRNAHGPFRSPEELKNVKGINAKNFSVIARHVKTRNKLDRPMSSN